MQGRRAADGTGPHLLVVGEYAYQADHSPPCWFARTPNGLIANLTLHKVTAHEDGTVTASPSILVDNLVSSWHGYLERGVWREC